MERVLIDTDILSLFLRGDPNVVKHAEKYVNEHQTLSFSIITLYEILSGLKYKDARKQLNLFEELASYSNILPLTRESVEISANIYADLRSKGDLIDDADILIAGIAMANSLDLATHNRSHFDRIEGLKVWDWAV